MFKILVVDDEPDIRDLVMAVLKTDNDQYSFVEAFDGEDALQKVKQENPNLIIMDIMMPRLDGIAACKKIKSEESSKNIPVLMLTVKAELGPKDEAFSAGANLYLTKPFDPEEIRSLIRGIFSGTLASQK